MTQQSHSKIFIQAKWSENVFSHKNLYVNLNYES